MSDIRKIKVNGVTYRIPSAYDDLGMTEERFAELLSRDAYCPTLTDPPGTSTTTYEDTDGSVNTFATGQKCRVRNADAAEGYDLWLLCDLSDGKASWMKLGGYTRDESDARYVRTDALVPTGMEVDYPDKIVYGNDAKMRVTARLLPEGVAQNVLYYCDDGGAASVSVDGGVTVNGTGSCTVLIVPTMNTSLARAVRIDVTEQSVRLVGADSIRLTSSGGVRFNGQ